MTEAQHKPRRKKTPRSQRLAMRSIAGMRAREKERRKETAGKKQGVLPPEPTAASRADDATPERLRATLPHEVVRAPDGSMPKVSFRGYSFRGMPDELIRAAARFAEDWEACHSGLGSMGFEPGVDGSKSDGKEFKNLGAQERVREIKRMLGQRDFTILVAVVIVGAGPVEMKKAAGVQHANTTNEIRRILREIATYYSGKEQRGDRLLMAAASIVKAALEDRAPRQEDVAALK